MFKILRYLLIVFLLVVFWWGIVGVGPAEAVSFFASTDDPCAYWKSIFDFAIKIAGALAMCFVVFGGFLWLMSEGDATKLEKAKDTIRGALTGLAIAMLSYVMFWALNPYLVECKIEIPEMKGVTGETATSCNGAYTSQADCESKESGCSSEGTKCAQSKKSCKGDGEKISGKSECCSGKSKYTKGTVPFLVCDGGTAVVEEKWCCPAPAAADPCAAVADDKLLATEADCKAKGGTSGGQCKGVCAQSTGSSEAKTESTSKDSATKTATDPKTTGDPATKTDARKGKWCCLATSCRSTAGFKQFTGGWEKNQYGSKCKGATMKSSGCGPSVVAEILSGYGKSVTPWTVAQEMDNKGLRVCGGGTKVQDMMSTLQGYGLKTSRVDWNTAKSGIQLGKLVIAHAPPGTIFTNKGHFLVLRCYKGGQVDVSNVGSGNQHKNKTGWLSESVVTSNTDYYILIDQ